MTAGNYDRLTAQFLAVVGENMPEISGHVMQHWMENPKALQNVLRNALCPPVEKNAATTTRAQPQFSTWKTINLGTHKSSNDLAMALKSAQFRIGEYAAQILKKIAIAPGTTEIELVNVSVRELGFKKRATSAQINARAMELGLDLVPAEVGPQLRLQYPDQPYGERVLIGMDPIGNSEGDPSVFGVVHELGGRSLGTSCGDAECFWIAELRWVFAHRKRN